MKAIIVDDEESARQTLTGLLARYCQNVDVLGEAGSVQQALDLLEQHQPDILFLDIQLRQETGFDLLDKLDDINFSVVFTTAYDHYAIRAIKSSAIDYLLKPIDPAELREAVDTAAQLNNKNALDDKLKVLLKNYNDGDTQNRQIVLPTYDGLEIVNVSEIIYCKGDRNYTRIFMTGGEEVLVSKTLKEYEDMLGESGFLRVHQSHLINVKQVRRYIKGRGGEVQMSDGTIVKVSRERKNDLIEVLYTQFG